MARRRIGLLRRLVVVLVKTAMTVLTRRTWTGMENLASSGGIIIAANHLSQADPLILAHYVYDAGRWPQFLAKAGVFRIPVVGVLLRRVRQIPVERGSVDAARSLDALVAAVRAGGAVIIYPEGTTTREPQLWPMRGKTGAARLAVATGAPVIPVAMWGPQHIFDPRTKRVSLRPRRQIAVAAGPPIDLSPWAGCTPGRAALQEMTDAIMTGVRDLLAELRGGTAPPLYEHVPRPGQPGPAPTSPGPVTSPGPAAPQGVGE